MKVVICGGGIVGVSIAYYLTKLGESDVTLVERHEIAGHASGKAGGFLAKSWCSSKLGQLARKSFDLHQELADELGTDVGYRRLCTLSVTAQETLQDASSPEGLPTWLDHGNVKTFDNIGSEADTAQVHPKQLVEAMAKVAEKRGTKIIKGKAEGVTLDDGVVKCVFVDGNPIDADVVVIAMGPWTTEASKWFPEAGIPKICGKRAHSIVLNTSGKEISPHAIFLNMDGKDPELYPRPDDTVYMCGNSDNVPLPSDPADITPSEAACEGLAQMASKISSSLEGACVAIKQACYLPHSPDGVPLIGRLPNYQGAYLAAGHTCWGILNGPATGLAMAELILRGAPKCVSLKAFDPARFCRS